MMTQFISPAESICLNINEGLLIELKHWLYRVVLPHRPFNPASDPASVLELKCTTHLRIQGFRVH